jgi:hypothetical protein
MQLIVVYESAKVLSRGTSKEVTLMSWMLSTMRASVKMSPFSGDLCHFLMSVTVDLSLLDKFACIRHTIACIGKTC